MAEDTPQPTQACMECAKNCSQFHSPQNPWFLVPCVDHCLRLYEDDCFTILENIRKLTAKDILPSVIMKIASWAISQKSFLKELPSNMQPSKDNVWENGMDAEPMDTPNPSDSQAPPPTDNASPGLIMRKFTNSFTAGVPFSNYGPPENGVPPQPSVIPGEITYRIVPQGYNGNPYMGYPGQTYWKPGNGRSEGPNGNYNERMPMNGEENLDKISQGNTTGGESDALVNDDLKHHEGMPERREIFPDLSSKMTQDKILDNSTKLIKTDSQTHVSKTKKSMEYSPRDDMAMVMQPPDDGYVPRDLPYGPHNWYPRQPNDYYGNSWKDRHYMAPPRYLNYEMPYRILYDRVPRRYPPYYN